MEMESFKYRAAEEDVGAVALVLELAKAFERVSLPVVWPGDALQFPKEDLASAVRYFEHQRRVPFEGCVVGPLQTTTASLLGSKWSCLLWRIAPLDALSEVMKVCPPLELKVFVNDFTACMEGAKRRGQAVGIALAERRRTRRQMAAAADKKRSVSLSLFMVVNDCWSLRRISSTMATLVGQKVYG